MKVKKKATRYNKFVKLIKVRLLFNLNTTDRFSINHEVKKKASKDLSA